MKNKILLFILVVLLIIYGYKRSSNSSFFYDNKVNLYDKKANENLSLDMRDYLIGVVAAEMPASFSSEALKAQAVAARTFAYYNTNQLTTDKSTQSYLDISQMQEKWGKDFDKYYSKISLAVDDTKDLVITYNNEIISAYYFSMSNGFTEEAINVFGENKSYLKSVISEEDENNHNYKVIKTINKDEFKSKLGIDEDVHIEGIVRNKTNHVDSIVVNGHEYSGTTFRKLLDLRSTDFEIVVMESSINITTYGYGHGVGMSQYGANTLAQKGYTWDEIIKHYYQNIKIKSINNL